MFQLVRRGVVVLAFGATLVGITATPVAAAQPLATPEPSVTDVSLTPAQQQAMTAKLAIAQQIQLSPTLASGKLNPLTLCPFSTSPMSASTLSGSTVAGLSVSPATSCNGQWGYVPTYPKVQETSYWCGPASIQVASNYVWRMPQGTDRWSQSQIAAWANTTSGGTNGSNETAALNKATAGSPYLPANWIYLSATSSQVSTGSRWHSLLRTDIASYSMPQIVSVAPKDPDSNVYLTSWANAKAQFAGHYIVLNGFQGAWDGTRGPIVTYDDSAIPPAGVSAYDPAADIYAMIMKTNVNKRGVLVAW
jgi:hypothetical protein